MVARTICVPRMTIMTTSRLNWVVTVVMKITDTSRWTTKAMLRFVLVKLTSITVILLLLLLLLLVLLLFQLCSHKVQMDVCPVFRLVQIMFVWNAITLKDGR
jgi:hypothetical protein